VRWKLSKALELHPGVDLWAGPYNVGITLPFEPQFELDPLGEREEFDFSTQGGSSPASRSSTSRFQPFPDAKRRWTITPGIRFDNAVLTFKGGNSFLITAVDPRSRLARS
jgi:hypothetical protein